MTTPLLFEATATTFTSLGIGSLADAISCYVTEERNGPYELEMKYPITGQHFADLAEERIIFVTPHERALDGQPFRIYKITRPMNGIATIYAEHVSYELDSIMVGPGLTASTLSAALSLLSSSAVPSNSFTYWTDKSVTAAWTVEEVKSVMACLKGEQGSILDVYGGELEFDGWTVKLHANRGSDRGLVISYGKNLTDLEKESDISSVITGMRPYWKDGNNQIVSLPSANPIVYNSHYTNYVYPRVQAIDVTDQYEQGISYSSMCTKARNYCSDYMSNNGTWELPANIRVKMIALWQTDEYKDNPVMINTVCNLCDTVTIKYEALGIETQSKVIKVVYDALNGRNSEIEIGTKRETLNDLIAEVARRTKK